MRANRFWQIAYPMAVYYLMYHFLHILFLVITGGRLGSLECLTLASAITLVVMVVCYRKLPITRAISEKRTIAQVLQWTGAILLTVAVGILLNIVISNTPLADLSVGYQEANSTLFSGGLLIKIVGNALLIPMLEEVVYRGIVCGQLLQWYGQWKAVFLSAFLFGIMHFNVVQFLYGFVMGLALGYIYVRYRRLWIPMAAHGLVNFVVILVTAAF